MDDTSPERIVFLDFDGVLNRSNTWPAPRSEYDPARNLSWDSYGERVWRLCPSLDGQGQALVILECALVARAREIVEATDAQVVISSSWRATVPLDEIRTLLEAAGWPEPPLLGTTDPDLFEDACARWQEVTDWLRRWGQPQAWVALDDDWGAPEDLDLPVIEVDPTRGLTEAQVSEAMLLLFDPPLAGDKA
ncbi:hypothetical protein AN478_07000 [Thiohalorhabdus denitrificans]|uniref:Uncharacterized protein n=1 Tax=Thiohalorhabdus denitrificans TaxID=381306 RepID=A0A0P9CTF2_9GAMM|nr:HAD domain-containing protein [Thiohalorhabdus denitrificans]KPV39938.1 hypothetical protein AN478_07000 [Thiohalorhabdus denitrificans]SCY09111.1 hypothetical protein SAMN05661077_1160 [Thiohalorhabdus denitrificans]